jgi:HAE1 family hydrophobic/amphiphilic exporter-1
MSMLALSLAIGVLVDDAIVVIENIYRHLTMGEEPVMAAINGRMEIGLAAIAITLADVVVFVPIAFMGGVVGQFFKPLGIGYAVAVLMSLFVSFTVTPMLASRWYRKGEDWEHPKGRFANWFENGFVRFGEKYAKLLAYSLRNRWKTFSLGFIILLAVFMFIVGSFVVMPDGGSFGDFAGEAFSKGMKPAMLVFAIGAAVFLVNLFKKQAKFGQLVFAVAVASLLPLGSLAGAAYRNLYKHENVFKFEFAPSTDSGSVSVSIELPPGSSLDATRSVAESVESMIEGHPDVLCSTRF